MEEYQHPSNYMWHVVGFKEKLQTLETMCYDSVVKGKSGLISGIEWALRKGAVEIHISRNERRRTDVS